MPDSLLPVSRNAVTATPKDIPWILSLAYDRYGPYDPGGGFLFLLQAIESPTALVLVDAEKKAFLIASTVAPPWYPDRSECHVIMLCTRKGWHWRGVTLLRESILWARLHHCVRWRFNSETEHDVGALCRRVGAGPDRERYLIELKVCGHE